MVSVIFLFLHHLKLNGLRNAVSPPLISHSALNFKDFSASLEMTGLLREECLCVDCRDRSLRLSGRARRPSPTKHKGTINGIVPYRFAVRTVISLFDGCFPYPIIKILPLARQNDRTV